MIAINNSGNVMHSTNNGNSSSKVTQDQNKGNSNSSKWVINLPSHSLTPAQVSLLSKGPNFALALLTSQCGVYFNGQVSMPKAFGPGCTGT